MERAPREFQEVDKIDRGTRATVYRKGDEIYKVLPGYISANRAFTIAREFSDDYETIRGWLGEYVVTTTFGVYENTNGFSVVIKQPYVQGISIRKAFDLASHQNFDNSKILDFLHKTLEMYRSTKKIPDIFGRPHVVGWYQFLTTPNIIVETKDNVLMPKLFDIGFARLSKNPLVGPLHNHLLADNLERTLKVNAG